MPIDLFEIENLFGDNNSYGVPNEIPKVFKRQFLDYKATPRIIDFLGGTIRVKGGNWNGAKYKGIYYILKKSRPLNRGKDLSVDEETGLYTMIRCVGCNSVLKNPVTITGDLIATQDESILEENINRCYISIHEPAEIHRISLEHAVAHGAELLHYENRIKGPSTEFGMGVVSKEALNTFHSAVHSSANVLAYEKARKFIHKEKPPVFIMGILRTHYDKEHNGQNKLVNKIKAMVNSLNEKNAMVITVGSSNIYASTSKIIGKVGLCTKEGTTIGLEDTTREVVSIDLSGLTEIIPIRFDNLQKEEPNKKFENMLNLEMTKIDYVHPKQEYVSKFCRKLYIPGVFDTNDKAGTIFPANNKLNKNKDFLGPYNDLDRLLKMNYNSGPIYSYDDDGYAFFGGSDSLEKDLFLYYYQDDSYYSFITGNFESSGRKTYYNTQKSGIYKNRFMTVAYDHYGTTPLANIYKNGINEKDFDAYRGSGKYYYHGVYSKLNGQTKNGKYPRPEQVVTLQIGDNSEPGADTLAQIYKGYLLGVDRVDFCLSGRKVINDHSLFTRDAYRDDNDGLTRVFKEYFYRYTHSPDGIAGAYPSERAGYRKTTPGLPSKFSKEGAKYIGYKFDYDKKKPNEYVTRPDGKRPVFGFLLYQLDKSGGHGNTFEYIGGTLSYSDKKIFKYSSGFNKDFYNFFNKDAPKKYPNKDYGFDDVTSLAIGHMCSTDREGGDATPITSFLLLLDMGLFAYFVPIFYEYYLYLDEYGKEYDGWGSNEYLTPNSTLVYQKVLSSVGKKGRKQYTSPYISASEYSTHCLLRRDIGIRDTVLYKYITFPKEENGEDYAIKKGDGLLPTLEYDLWGYDTSVWAGNARDVTAANGDNRGTETGRGIDLINFERLGDQMGMCITEKLVYETDLDKHFDPHDREFKRAIVLCSDGKTGQLEYREMSWFRRKLTLTDSEENIVKDVNGTREDTQYFFRLRNPKPDSNEYKGSSNWDSDQVKVMKIFLSTHHTYNYDVAKNKYTGYTEEDFASETPLLFDLKGTEGYCFIKENKVTLILKDNVKTTAIKTIIKNTDLLYSLKKSEEKSEEKSLEKFEALKNKDLLSKINQFNTVNFKTKAIPIKARFKFDNTDKLSVTVNGLDVGNAISSLDYFLYKVGTEGDFQEDLLRIAKRPGEILDLATQIQLDRHRLEIERADEDRLLQTEQLDIQKQKYDYTYDRTVWDLNYDGNQDLFNSIIGIFGGEGQGTARLNLPYIYKRLKANTKLDIISGASPEDADYLDKVAMGGARGWTMDEIHKGRIDFSANGGKLASIGLGIATNAAKIGGNLGQASTRGHEGMKRAGEDRDLGYREIAYQSLTFDKSQFRKKQDSLMRMNAQHRNIIRTHFNDTSLVEKFLEQKNLKDIYLTIKFPTEEQLKSLRSFVEEFGVDCDIPCQKITLQSGMKKGVYRFKNLQSQGIEGISDILEREIIKHKLLTGIRIIPNNTPGASCPA